MSLNAALALYPFSFASLYLQKVLFSRFGSAQRRDLSVPFVEATLTVLGTNSALLARGIALIDVQPSFVYPLCIVRAAAGLTRVFHFRTELLRVQNVSDSAKGGKGANF